MDGFYVIAEVNCFSLPNSAPGAPNVSDLSFILFKTNVFLSKAN